jgi:hypothetical protein
VKIKLGQIGFAIEWTLLALWLLDGHEWAWTAYFRFTLVFAIVGLTAAIVLDGQQWKEIWTKRPHWIVASFQNGAALISWILMFRHGHPVAASVFIGFTVLAAILYRYHTRVYRNAEKQLEKLCK